MTYQAKNPKTKKIATYPYIQTDSDPAPGYYVSPTALFDRTKKKSDPRRYVNSSEVAYVVRNLTDKKEGVEIGDFAIIKLTKATGVVIEVPAIFADHNNGSQGEISIRAAELLGIPSSPTNGGLSAKNMEKCGCTIELYWYQNSATKEKWGEATKLMFNSIHSNLNSKANENN